MRPNPTAPKVIHVSSAAPSAGRAKTLSKSQLNQLSNATGSQYEKLQKKTTAPIATPGKAPPKDNKAPGGGSGGGQSFG